MHRACNMCKDKNLLGKIIREAIEIRKIKFRAASQLCFVQVSGPLFGDLDVIEFKYREFIWRQCEIDAKFMQMKCIICGFPNCTCNVCSFMSRNLFRDKRSKQVAPHECNLKGVKAGAPSKTGRYTEAQEAKRIEAWEIVGASSVPKFYKGPGWSGYYFEQEMDDATASV